MKIRLYVLNKKHIYSYGRISFTDCCNRIVTLKGVSTRYDISPISEKKDNNILYQPRTRVKFSGELELGCNDKSITAVVRDSKEITKTQLKELRTKYEKLEANYSTKHDEIHARAEKEMKQKIERQLKKLKKPNLADLVDKLI